MKTAIKEKTGRVYLALISGIILAIIYQVNGEGTLNHFTPVPLIDINKDLRPLYFGSESDYFLSTYKADAVEARQVCQNLTNLTGKHFHLLILEHDEEADELMPYLDSLDIPGVWTAGEKSFNDNGDISVFWSTNDGIEPMSFKNFRNGVSVRMRRDIDRSSEGIEVISANSVVSKLHPWLKISESENGGKCRSGKYTPPECEPVQCNVTMPECTTVTPACTVHNMTDCSVTRPDCTAKCEECTVVPPVCTATPQPCTVTTQLCQTIRAPCNITTPDCITTRPPCKTIQPPCEVITPPPCTTARPKCVPSFRNDNCTTVTFPCKTNKKNETICPEPQTICEPSYKCPPPEICQSPAIICPPPLIYCEPETTVCPEAEVICPKPAIYCPQPEVNCPEPVVNCTAPQVLCLPPVVNCPGIVTSCPAPQLECPPPTVDCPAPIVNCTTPEPCAPPTSTPPCSTTPEPTTMPTTTPKCPGCGCVLMSKEYMFKWDIETCHNEYHFICEG